MPIIKVEDVNYGVTLLQLFPCPNDGNKIGTRKYKISVKVGTGRGGSLSLFEMLSLSRHLSSVLSFQTATACFRACFPFENVHLTRQSASSKSETGTLGTIPVQYY